MNENYLMINGKRVDLTDEQIEKLGFNPRKDRFEYTKRGEYYCVTAWGNVRHQDGRDVAFSEECYSSANYCTDEQLMQQRAYYETLSRLLWRLSMQNDGDKIDWEDMEQTKYYVYYDNRYKTFEVSGYHYSQPLMTVFYSENIAKRAIDEIIEPFMKEHPDFVW